MAAINPAQSTQANSKRSQKSFLRAMMYGAGFSEEEERFRFTKVRFFRRYRISACTSEFAKIRQFPPAGFGDALLFSFFENAFLRTAERHLESSTRGVVIKNHSKAGDRRCSGRKIWTHLLKGRPKCFSLSV
jgi:hypothetical protein